MANHYDIVDFHSHILPGADHGSANIETSLYQLAEAYKNGFKRIFATSHFYPTAHSVDSFITRRNEAYKNMMKEINFEHPEVKLGAEVLICDNIEDLPGLEKLFFFGTNTMLLELPFSNFQESYCDSVYNLLSRDVNVIIAHADRYPPDIIERILDVGAKIQLNAGSLLHIFKRKSLYDWLQRGVVVGLGSDIHGRDKNAYPGFVKAISKIEPYINLVKDASDKIFAEAKHI